MITLLLAEGAHVNAAREDGSTALWVAARGGQEGCVAELLQVGWWAGWADLGCCHAGTTEQQLAACTSGAMPCASQQRPTTAHAGRC